MLEVDSDWVMPDGSVILKEHTKYVFSGSATTRTIDRITTLTAGATRVDLKDNKEGVLGLRVTRALEEPSTKPEVFTDAAGRPTTVASLDNTGVNGVYLTSEGKQGRRAWGTRGKWTTLVGQGRRRAGVDRHLRRARQSRLSDLLARARLRAVCGQPARAEGAQRRQGRAELRDRAEHERDLQAPHPRRHRRAHRGAGGSRVDEVDGREGHD